MNTYTLVGVPTDTGAERRLRKDPATEERIVFVGDSLEEAHAWLFEHAEPEDWYMEAGSPDYPGNSIGALKKLMAAINDAIFGRITPEEHDHIRAELRNE